MQDAAALEGAMVWGRSSEHAGLWGMQPSGTHRVQRAQPLGMQGDPRGR